ncbi:glucose/sorbosone family PQQ-dependent dehydrogenase [Candidatus Nitrosocosmicus sp. FF01]|uniref:glucose/sorbosone family PQQ-dependent dehydrogenase n=1 Tax=Candidatus Nitrosocosmicus sp. FF01 TaxID=3397670 RepID=UPI0039E94D29
MQKPKASKTVTTVLALLILSLMPTTLYSSSINSPVTMVSAQEDPSSAPFNTSPENQNESSQNATTTTNATTERVPTQQGFETKVLATNLSQPHNIIYGPDDMLWITERFGKVITLVDPLNGTKVATMPVPEVHQSEGQDGLLGMALDPDFSNNHYIYVAYTYDANPGEDLERLTKITKFTFDPSTYSISEPVDLISGLQGSIDHNSGRLAFGPDGKLYYTIGDQGKNQLSLFCLDIEAQTLPTAEEVADQNWTAYQGKVLRMNTDGSIPEDNPEINGVQSHIYTYGHRNPQGLTVGPEGDLYVAEHGPNSDDEVNHLVAGGNFGWPYIAGYQDDKAYRYVNWSSAGEQCPNLNSFNITSGIAAGVSMSNESEFNAPNLIEPVVTFFTVESNYNFTDHNCGELAYICNPTVAPSSLRLYNSDTIPGWENTLLMPTLKAGKIYKLTLNDNGTALSNEPIELFHSENRYRDVAISPDGSTLFVITDSEGPAQAIGGGATTELWNPGSVLEFKYVGENINKMTGIQ